MGFKEEGCMYGNKGEAFSLTLLWMIKQKKLNKYSIILANIK